jgi:hypothetical protein
MSFDAAVALLATGALGGAHCAAMCGPLVVGGCSNARGIDRPRAIGYFVARSVAYATVGAVLGHLGRHALCILPARAFAITTALIVAASALFRAFTTARAALRPSVEPELVQLRSKPRPSTLSRLASVVLPRGGPALGLATAILPCGLLVSAWTLAAAEASAPRGAATLFAFSIVTAPGLLAPLLGKHLARGFVQRLPRWVFVLGWLAVAGWMVWRAMMPAGACHTM